MSTTTKPTFRDLERLARQAHARGEQWAAVWPRVADGVVRMAGASLVRFQRLRDRLLSIVVAGDANGLEPIGSGANPWDLDDQGPVDVVGRFP